MPSYTRLLSQIRNPRTFAVAMEKREGKKALKSCLQYFSSPLPTLMKEVGPWGLAVSFPINISPNPF